LVAIAYLGASFPRLLPAGGCQKLFGYVGRYDVFDRHAGRHFAFAEIAADLVYQDVLLPADAPVEFADPAALARAIDGAEAKRMRKMSGRLRWPQIAAAFVAALPPDTELTYDEAVGLTHRLADYIRRDLPIGVYLAIHDPALESPGAVNRHAHLMATTRPMNALGFVGKKLREFIARPRQADGQTYVAEGVNWPRVYTEILTTYFAELGLDLTVAPHFPIGHRHWPKSVWRTEPERVAAHRREVHERNRAIIFGPEKELVERLLRGRSILPIAVLQQLLPHFIDNEDQRTHRLNEILADPQLVTLAIHPGDQRPSRVTTRAIHDLIQTAVALVTRAGRTKRSSLVVVSRSTSNAITSEIIDRIDQDPPQRLTLAGQIHSHCATLSEKMAGVEHAIFSVKSLLSPPQPDPSIACNPSISAGDVIVLPHAEQTDDQWLAALIVAAADRGAQLILGYDQSWKVGVVSNRLATWIAEKLDQSTAALLDFTDIEHELRCGRVERAIHALAKRGVLHFGQAKSQNEAPPDFVVCDDEREVARAAANIATASDDGLEHGPNTLAVGQWIAFTRTDYSTVPPNLRAGRLARIAYILPEGRKIVVQHPDDRLQEVDLAKFPHVRPAPVITLREACHVSKNARLAVRLTKPQRAWSCVLLAAAGGKNTVVEVDPAVANNIAELIQVVQRSLPSALPTELSPCADPNAEVIQTLAQITAKEGSLVPPDLMDTTPELEDFPEPDTVRAGALANDVTPSDLQSFFARQWPTVNAGGPTPQSFSRSKYGGSIRTIIPHHRFHEKLWAALASTPDGQTAVDRLEQLRDHADAEAIYLRLQGLEFWNDQGPTAALVRAAMALNNETLAPDKGLDEEIDTPPDLHGLARDWDLWDLFLFRIDIQTIASYSSRWREALEPSTSPRPGPA